MIKTRFAPSPTGFLHIGSLRTALFAYLFAKKNNGNFLLRIEDTDRERYVEGGVENIKNTLAWCGLQYNGEPYVQSEHLEVYQKYANELISKGHAYYCFCSKERLNEVRKIQELNKQATGYDGHCRNLEPGEAKKRVEAGESHVIRMKMPKEGNTKFIDLVRGEVIFENKLIDDQVILKTDGFPTYHLAVVVDDHLMEITHVIRGEEWLSSTPKHLELYKMFGWQPPQFAHLPLMLNADRSKLSKRQGDVAVEDYIKKGYLPEAVLNFVAFLGWNPGNDQEIFSLAELIKEFSLDKVNKAGGVFNLEKLDWYNKEYLKRMDTKNLLDSCKPLFEEKYETSDFRLQTSDDLLEKVLLLEKERATTTVELVENLRFIFEEIDYKSKILVWKKSDKAKIKENLVKTCDFLTNLSDFSKENLQTKVGEWIKENGLSNGEVLWPLRVALSGQENSPGPFEIAEVLGKEKSLERVNSAINKLQ